MSNVNVAGEAFCVIDVNFTNGIETGGSFMASGHQRPTEGTHAEVVGSSGVGSLCVHPRIAAWDRQCYQPYVIPETVLESPPHCHPRASSPSTFGDPVHQWRYPWCRGTPATTFPEFDWGVPICPSNVSATPLPTSCGPNPSGSVSCVW